MSIEPFIPALVAMAWGAVGFLRSLSARGQAEAEETRASATAQGTIAGHYVDLVKKTDAQQAEIRALDRQLSNMRLRVSGLEAQIADLRSQIAVREAQLNDYMQLLADNDALIHKQQSEIADLRRQLEAALAERDRLRAQLAEASAI